MFLVLFGSGPSKRSPCPDQTKSKSSSPGIEWIMRNGKTLLNKGIQKGAGGASVDDRRWPHDGDGGVHTTGNGSFAEGPALPRASSRQRLPLPTAK